MTTLAKVPVVCPHCGQVAWEPASAYSTVCRKCQGHFRLQEALHPTAAPAPVRVPTRRFACFGCGGALEAVVAAQSTLCKHCGRYVDLRDYRVSEPMPRSFQTKGRLVIEPDGLLINTDTTASDVVLKGRVMGRLVAEGVLEIHPSAEIRGTFKAQRLVVQAGATFRWPEALRVGAVDVAGELVADVLAEGRVALRNTARYFGDLRAADLLIEAGAVCVGHVRVSA